MFDRHTRMKQREQARLAGLLYECKECLYQGPAKDFTIEDLCKECLRDG
jgi:hypothetical protein